MQVLRARIGTDTEHWQLRDESGVELSFERVYRSWKRDDAFTADWSSALRDVPFDAYCWECPPVTAVTLTRTFECVFVSSPVLAELPADPRPFAEHFRPDADVVTFESLGKDALLIAPCPKGHAANYAHLASFIATAPERQQSALWKAVGDALTERVGAQPVWLSTAGLGVAWLHVRLDSRPKYYRHAPYTLVDQRLR